MKILAYKGVSLISRAIQFQTRSPYSHVAIEPEPYKIWEAWHVNGVRRIRYALDGHDRDTKIDVYELTVDCDVDAVKAFLAAQEGKKYDFKSVARFVSRRKTRADDKWFCSELVLAALSAGGVDLLHINHSEASPRDVTISPLLALVSQ